MYLCKDCVTLCIIELAICEVRDLDQWIDTTEPKDQDSSIQMKKYPQCRVPIRRNFRYSTIIKTQLNDIEQVKRRVLGDSKQNDRKQNTLLQELSRLEDQDLQPYEKWLREEKFSTDEMNCIENIVEFLKHLNQWRAKLAEA